MTSNDNSDQLANGKFLLVDDDSEHLAMLERCLERLGFAFASAGDGVQALALLTAEPFAIVISDIQMPGIDGLELLRTIRREYTATDVILMTGYSQTYTFTDVIREGATDYLEKPFIKDALRAKIMRILRERALLAEYHRELARRHGVEEALKAKSADLEKRVRELHCLYQVSSIVEQKKALLEEIFQATIAIIPPALRQPRLAVVQLRHGAAVYAGAGFRQTPWSLTHPILAQGREVGALTVCYTQEVAGEEGELFPEEDQALIKEIAERMGRAIDRLRAEGELRQHSANLEAMVGLRTRELHQTQAALEAVFQNIPDGILSVDGAMVVTHGNAHSLRNLEFTIGKPFPAVGSRFQEECRTVLNNTLATREAVSDYRIEIRHNEQLVQVVLVSTSLLRDDAMHSAGALLVIHDITRLADLESQLQERRRFRQLIGTCPQLREIYGNVRKLASVDTTVLITGESGTGKELLVETLHASGNRAAKPLIKVNCAALPENLLESELFGHVRGAFTGAVKDRAGRIQAAEGGILLLDEIGDISPRIQLKLLRFLEIKEYERVGESQTRRADVRVFAATNADLARKVREGLFREDLYYRLKVMVIHLPPLRERMEDIPLLVDHFLALFNKKFHKTITGGTPEFLAILMGYPWPGNIRELKHVVEHAILLSAGPRLHPEDLPKDLVAGDATPAVDDRQPARTLTREALLAALGQTGGNKAKTAKILKVSRATLYKKIREFAVAAERDS